MSVPDISQTPLFRHACLFATKPTLDGPVTAESIKKGQEELRDTVCVSGLRRHAILNAINGNPTVEGLCQTADNPARSGIWNVDCTLNPERLRALKGRCVDLNGTPVLTRAIFQQFIDERRATEYKGCLPYSIALGSLTRVGCLPVPYTTVADASIDAFFHANARFDYGKEKAVAWNSVCAFYDPDNSVNLRED